MRVSTIVFLALSVSGCATITRGTNQTVAVNTPGVAGATCILSSSAIGSHTVMTPGTISLEKSKQAVSVRCTKECYNDGAGIIPSNFEGMTAGNIIIGGLIGFGVDAASGAMNNYAPEVQVVMTPIPACGRIAQEQPRRHKREPLDAPRRDPVDRPPVNPVNGRAMDN